MIETWRVFFVCKLHFRDAGTIIIPANLLCVNPSCLHDSSLLTLIDSIASLRKRVSFIFTIEFITYISIDMSTSDKSRRIAS